MGQDFQWEWRGKDTSEGQMSLLWEHFLPQAFNLRAYFSYCRNSHRLQTGHKRIPLPIVAVQLHVLPPPS